MAQKKWIAGATKNAHGQFSAKAKKRNMSTREFAHMVLAHPEKYDERTRKQANLARTLMGMVGHK